MEALLIEYAKRYGMKKAIEMLGLEKTQNPEFTFGMPFTNKDISFNPVNMLTKYGLNKLTSGGIGGILGPAAFLGGAVMLGRAYDPMRPGSKNYSPNLRGQVDYLSNLPGMIGRDAGSGLAKYGPGSVLSGQNVSSMFGTNNYQTQLQNYIDKQLQRKDAGKGYNKTGLNKALKEKDDFFEYRADIKDKAKVKSSAPTFTPPNIHSDSGNNGGGGGGRMSASDFSDDTAGTPFRRGGIASL